MRIAHHARERVRERERERARKGNGHFYLLRALDNVREREKENAREREKERVQVFVHFVPTILRAKEMTGSGDISEYLKTVHFESKSIGIATSSHEDNNHRLRSFERSFRRH